MFKGILPKRIASTDFTMITALNDPATAPNKENQPGASKTASAAPASKGNPKSRKRADTKGKEQSPVTPEGMEVAFDKLLVGRMLSRT
jgi:hypothetical protein